MARVPLAMLAMASLAVNLENPNVKTLMLVRRSRALRMSVAPICPSPRPLLSLVAPAVPARLATRATATTAPTLMLVLCIRASRTSAALIYLPRVTVLLQAGCARLVPSVTKAMAPTAQVGEDFLIRTDLDACETNGCPSGTQCVDLAPPALQDEAGRVCQCVSQANCLNRGTCTIEGRERTDPRDLPVRSTLSRLGL